MSSSSSTSFAKKQNEANEARSAAIDFLKRHEQAQQTTMIPRDNTLEFMRDAKKTSATITPTVVSQTSIAIEPSTVEESPPGWELVPFSTHVGSATVMWWRHLATGSCTPQSDVLADVEMDLPPIPRPWKLVKTLQNEEHPHFYWNPITGDRVWEIPVKRDDIISHDTVTNAHDIASKSAGTSNNVHDAVLIAAMLGATEEEEAAKTRNRPVSVRLVATHATPSVPVDVAPPSSIASAFD